MIILCSTNEKVIERWHEGLVGQELTTCNSHDDLVGHLQQSPGAIVLQHLAMQGLHSAAEISSVISQNPGSRIIACADVPDDEEGLAYLKAGVYGYCNTWMAPAQLGHVIELVSAGEVWVGRTLVLRLINNLPSASATGQDFDMSKLPMLSSREQEVAKMVGQGMSNKRIADALDITERTVKAHLSAIFRKTGCNDRIQLALLVSQAS